MYPIALQSLPLMPATVNDASTGSGTRCSKRKNASAVPTGRCDVVSDGWLAPSRVISLGQTLNLCQQLKKLDLLFVPGAVFPYPSNRQAWRPRSSSPVRGDARYGRAPSFLCLRTSFRFCWPARINEIAEYRDGSTARWSSPPTALVLDFLHLYLRDVPW